MARPHARGATLGFSPHTGWAAVVAIAEGQVGPEVVAKRRLELASTFEVGAVYHQGQALTLEAAEALVRSSEKTFLAAARAWIRGLSEELRGRGLGLMASAVLAGNEKPLPPLASILRSHALVHAAEGALYRRVLVGASEACAIPAALVPPQDLAARVGAATGVTESRISSALAEAGKASGKPWTKDQKDATLAAWLVLLAGPPRRDSRSPQALHH